MATWLAENLNERETITERPARLHGWSLTNTGREGRYVTFKDENRTTTTIVVPAGVERNISGLDEPYPNGLSVESLKGDGTLIANIFFTVRKK